MDTLTTTATDSLTNVVNNNIPNFGVFEQLANYGALGLAALALGAVCWFFIKRHLDEKDRLQRKLDEMNKEK
jgi:hypothetical protein